MTFESILYPQIRAGQSTGEPEAPEYFHDLNLDQIVTAATAGTDEYDLRPFFYRPLDDLDDIAWRQQVMQDLEDPQLHRQIAGFAQTMRDMRSCLAAAAQAHYPLQKNRWFLDAARLYCRSVRQLLADLTQSRPSSRGFQEFREHLSSYVAGPFFTSLANDNTNVETDLRSIRYGVVIQGLAVTVRKFRDEIDYSEEIEDTFAKFRQGAVKDYLVRFPEFTGMGHVEAQITDLVARLHPEIFAHFDEYCTKYWEFVDPVLARFDREVQFYLSYLRYIAPLRSAGLAFCYPKVVRETKAVDGCAVFDLALAARLASEGRPVVPNDFRLEGVERVLVVSGPNQGGKTTLARTLGQLHHLANLGCPVPGSSARLFLCDRILTHFEKEERIEDLRGKLQDDLIRIRHILEQATPQSLVVINEIFSSTALEDAVFLATEIMHRILALDCLCVCVTFLDEIAALGPAVVSMVSAVEPDDPARRTFKLIRRPADGRAYAMAIAEKHRLDYRSLRRRLAS